MYCGVCAQRHHVQCVSNQHVGRCRGDILQSLCRRHRINSSGSHISCNMRELRCWHVVIGWRSIVCGVHCRYLLNVICRHSQHGVSVMPDWDMVGAIVDNMHFMHAWDLLCHNPRHLHRCLRDLSSGNMVVFCRSVCVRYLQRWNVLKQSWRNVAQHMHQLYGWLVVVVCCSVIIEPVQFLCLWAVLQHNGCLYVVNMCCMQCWNILKYSWCFFVQFVYLVRLGDMVIANCRNIIRSMHCLCCWYVFEHNGSYHIISMHWMRCWYILKCSWCFFVQFVHLMCCRILVIVNRSYIE